MDLNHEKICGELCGFLSENILAEGVHVDHETGLGSLGVDSYALLEVLLFIERRFNVVLPEQSMTPLTFHNVSNLAGCISEQLESPTIS